MVSAQSVFAEENLCISQLSQFQPLKLQYSFDGMGTVENICISASRSILVYVNVTDDSSITINIPKNFLCFLGLYDEQYGDQDLIVLINGGEVDFTQSMRKNRSQDITINVKDGRNKIEIIGGSLINSTLACLSPKVQQQVGFSADQIMCKSDMFKMIKISNNTPVCVTPSSAQKLIERGWGSKLETIQDSKTPNETLDKKYTLRVNDNIFEIRYSIIGAQLQEITVDTNAKSIIVNLENSGKGHLIIEIPRKWIDAKNGLVGTFGEDGDFLAYVDGSEVDFEETSSIIARTLTIPFENDSSQIEIIETFPYLKKLG
ncbi:MAG: hypothetical protein HZA84_08755 [Thaumarchaeota archaeon]|nr:hypothetical protein [Nitrososphaerota archaeon]